MLLALNGSRYPLVGGRGLCLGAGKTRSQKMPENAAESHTSGTCLLAGAFRNYPLLTGVARQGWQDNMTKQST